VENHSKNLSDFIHSLSTREETYLPNLLNYIKTVMARINYYFNPDELSFNEFLLETLRNPQDVSHLFYFQLLPDFAMSEKLIALKKSLADLAKDIKK
jgi:hypothetical protein